MSETPFDNPSVPGRKQKPKPSLAKRIVRLVLFAVILFVVLLASGCGIATLMYYLR